MLLQLPFDILQKVLCALHEDVHEGFTARAEVIEGFEAHHMPSPPPPPSHALYCTCKVGGCPEGALTIALTHKWAITNLSSLLLPPRPS